MGSSLDDRNSWIGGSEILTVGVRFDKKTSRPLKNAFAIFVVLWSAPQYFGLNRF